MGGGSVVVRGFIVFYFDFWVSVMVNCWCGTAASV